VVDCDNSRPQQGAADLEGPRPGRRGRLGDAPLRIACCRLHRVPMLDVRDSLILESMTCTTLVYTNGNGVGGVSRSFLPDEAAAPNHNYEDLPC